MEVYAGFVSYTDHEFGRVVDFLEEIGELDNTLFILISDNGAQLRRAAPSSLNEMMFFNNVPESIEENLERIDELAAPTCSTTTLGTTNAGTRRSGAGSARRTAAADRPPVHRVVAGQDHGTAVRSAPSMPRHRPGGRPSWTPSASGLRPRSGG